MLQNILLIQDDPQDAQAVRDALTASGNGLVHIEWVRSCSAGLERLQSEGRQAQADPERIAAVLVDLTLPDSHGIATFDRLFRAVPQIPILVLSSAKDEDTARLAVERGAQDYLLQGRLDSYLLPKALHNIVERAATAGALFEEKERAQVTLNSIGDAVISTDVENHVTYLNAVAEGLTGWSLAEATGHPLEDVVHIVDSVTRATAPNPTLLAIRENRTVALTPNCILIRRDGIEAAIEDSVAPIHDRHGQVTGAVMVFRDVTTARALSLSMSFLVQHDSLTQLPNRALLSDRLSQAMALAQRQGQMLSVLYLDVDRFKHINDSLGHAVGDRVLHAVAQRLLACVRSSDTVSRQGGDEFVILLSPVANADNAAAIADKILRHLSEPLRIDPHDLHITVSIGIATYPGDGTDAETMLKHADIAMYHAKENGRNNYQFFKPAMNARSTERYALEKGLREAIEQQQFVLYYQPQLNLETGAIVGVEALVRWRHPQRGLVPPGQFISLAEECGLTVPIGLWVLREACRQARVWQSSGLPQLRIAVNISAALLRAKDLVASMRQILAETHLDPGYLELELTETFLMQDIKSTTAVLESLKDLGVRLALDDFGTGYSSLSNLRRFPIDTLKIDQSFVRNLCTDAGDANIVKAMVSMGTSLRMRVVAEGVETAAQLAFLREQGCSDGQGFYFSLPVSAEDFSELLIATRGATEGHKVRHRTDGQRQHE